MSLFLAQSLFPCLIINKQGEVIEVNNPGQALALEGANFFALLVPSLVQKIKTFIFGEEDFEVKGKRYHLQWEQEGDLINLIAKYMPLVTSNSTINDLPLNFLKTGAIGYWEWNPVSGKISFDNDWFTRLGIVRDNSSIENWKKTIHPEDVDMVSEKVKDHLEGKTIIFESIIRFQSVSGGYKNILSKGKVVERDLNGQAIKFCGIHVDLTDMMGLQNEIDVKRMQLVQSAKMSTLGEMAGNIAHEINTPLAVILACADMIEPTLNAHLAPRLRMIKDSTFKISTVVKSLRYFSDAGKEESKDLSSIKAAVQQAVDLCSEGLKRQKIELTTEVEDYDLVINKVQIIQVIINLLKNAKEAAESVEKPFIKVLGKKTDAGYELKVFDNGTGIEPRVKLVCMQPFVTTKSLEKHAGIGLSVAKTLMEEHQGRLWLDEMSSNTCFVLSFKG